MSIRVSRTDAEVKGLTRPATRYGRAVVYPGGHTVWLSRRERLLFALGLKKSITTERRSA